MKKQSEFQLHSGPIIDIIRQAVDEQQMSLSEIASRAGLSVPTIARIYNRDVQLVQAKTARRLAEALGYELDLGGGGRVRFEKIAEKSNKTGLSYGQKAQIRKVLERAIEDALNKL
jgi:transcriptional regulator with XRE-family HTH domain